MSPKLGSFFSCFWGVGVGVGGGGGLVQWLKDLSGILGIHYQCSVYIRSIIVIHY